MAMIIIYNGKRYPGVEKPMLAETGYCESQLKTNVADWTSMQATMAAIYMSVKRVDPGLLSWEALGQLTADDFSTETEPDEPAGVTQVPPESEWPLDPTGGEAQVVNLSVSDQKSLPALPIDARDMTLPSVSTAI